MYPLLVNRVSFGSDNGLAPGRHQAIIWTNAGILLIGPLGINFSEILINTFSFKKMHLQMSSAKWRPFCPRGDELTSIDAIMYLWPSSSVHGYGHNFWNIFL